MPTSKTGGVPKLTDFLLLCTLKSTFFSPPHRDVQRLREQRPHGQRKKQHGKWGNILSTFSANLPVQLKHAYSM